MKEMLAAFKLYQYNRSPILTYISKVTLCGTDTAEHPFCLPLLLNTDGKHILSVLHICVRVSAECNSILQYQLMVYTQIHLQLYEGMQRCTVQMNYAANRKRAFKSLFCPSSNIIAYQCTCMC